MLIRTLDNIVGTRGEVHRPKRHSFVLLSPADDMHLSFSDSILEAGFEITLGPKNHRQTITGQAGYCLAGYCLEGEGTISELDGANHQVLRPGTFFALKRNEPRQLRAETRMRLITAIFPALDGPESLELDGWL